MKNLDSQATSQPVDSSRKITTRRLLILSIVCLLLPRLSSAQQTGVFEWANGAGGTAGYDLGASVALDASGNVYATGSFYGTVDFDPGSATFNLTTPSGQSGGFISKSDANGNFIWTKAMIGDAGGYAVPVAMVTDASGNVYLTGYLYGTVHFDPVAGVFSATSAGYEDIFMAKLDGNGNFVWVKTLPGVSLDEKAKSMTIDGSGNLYLSGDFKYIIDFDPGPGVYNLSPPAGYNGVFCSKYDNNGNLVWAKNISYPVVSGYNGWPGGESIALDASGNVYTTGAFRMTADFNPGTGVFNMTALTGGTNRETDVYILKLDNDGNFVWAKSFGNPDWNYGDAVRTDAAGNVYTIGSYGGNTLDFNPGPGVFNLSGDAFYVSKLDSDGNFVWAKSLGGYFGIFPRMEVDASGNVYAAGVFNNTADFDPGAGVFNLTGVGYDIFISKMDSNGNFIWATSMGGTDRDEIRSIVLDGSGNLYTTGAFQGTADFDPGVCVHNLISKGYSDSFVSKLRQASATAPPVISSFSPGTGAIGTTVTITGTGFSPTPGNNVVKFFNNKTATVTASTATSITTTVPAGTTTGKISVTTNCITATSATDFVIGAAVFPTITSFTPASGPVGMTVTVTGTNFSATPANNTMKFNGTTSVVTASTTTSITTTVPSGATTGKITVTVGGNTATSANDFTVTTVTTNPPSITPQPLFTQVGGMVTLDLVPLISTPNDNLDISSIQITVPPSSGAEALITGGLLTINYAGISFSGVEQISIVACDLDENCVTQQFNIEVTGDLIVFNAVSPDGANPSLVIQNIESFPETMNNEVTIFDRWQNEVWRGKNYDNSAVVFKGASAKGSELPSGTYYYRIHFESGKKTLTGFISLKR